MASLSMHGKVIGITLIFLLLLAISSQWSAGNADSETDSPVIAFEHGSPMTFSLTVSRRGTVRIVEIDDNAKDTVFVSVPQDWRRTEIRGVALSSVTSQPPSLGFVRFTLPAHAGITFQSEGSWQHVTVKNPRHIPMTLKFTGVDGNKNTSVHDVILMKDQEVRVP